MKKKKPAPHPLTPDDFNFDPFPSWYHQLLMLTAAGLTKLAGRPFGFVTLKQKEHSVTLSALAGAVGFGGPEYEKLLRYHERRLKWYGYWAAPLAIVMMAVYLLLFFLYFERGMDALGSFGDGVEARLAALGLPSAVSIGLTLLLALIIFSLVFPLAVMFIMMVIQGTLFRFYDYLVRKRYAPSLCVNTSLYVLLFLSRDDVLTNLDLRRSLLSYMRHLSFQTLLLSLYYRSTDAPTEKKVSKHFKAMEGYLRERERRIIVPDETTLGELRKDMTRLTAMYIESDFGSFPRQHEEAVAEAPGDGWRGFLPGLVRFVGLALPLALMGSYLWNPQLFPNVDADRKLVSLIFIAWLLLALEVGLKLGIIGQLTSIAKGIKDLK